MFRALILAAAAATLTSGAALRTRYDAGRVLRVVSESTLSLETAAFEVSVGGEPIERPVAGGGTYSTRMTRRSVSTDRVLEADDGRPTRVRRAFEQLSSRVTTAFASATSETERPCPLEHCELELLRPAQGERAGVTVVAGAAPSDPAALAGHGVELALDALLPEGEVAPGATWRLSAGAVRRALGLDLAPALFPEPPIEESPEGADRKSQRRFRMYTGSHTKALREAAWEGTATLESLDVERAREGSAVVRLELWAEGALPTPPGELTSAGTFAVRLEGRLTYALEAALPTHLELEGLLTERRVSTRTVRGTELLIEATLEGPLTHVVDVSVADE